MKLRYLFFILFLVYLASICLLFSNAETELEQYECEYEYEIVDDGVCVTYYEGNQPIVIIPAELDGYKVVSIGDSAFSDVQSLWSIIIPDTVKTIEKFAFFESSLKEVCLPKGLESIGDSAFACTDVTSILIPETVKYVGNTAFYCCYDLTYVKILATISEINYKTFFDCIHLKEIIIPETVTQIGEGAFYRCQSLENIKHYQQIDTIYEDSFDSCDSLSDDIVNYFSLVTKLPASNNE